ncbi:helix-turn-helix domain-containing protein [Arthrobacter sp. ISL-28]|uniref:helix-turn-helix domain-containing protein n=1 Tax=Arthrobacter sp. ISL-28 TaxID=2819108 RepID=UPI001BED06D0|nr:helix-turn-helix domain-containing protein [Arthrobacter sp. ISL-28]MBT2523238.1 helix-turn-helix domain-containing protein [Arthrobacter sp. ISL-28]
MPRKTTEPDATPPATTASTLPRMLTLEQVQEILNVKGPLVYALVRSGELRAAQFGGRGYLAQSRGSMPFLPGTHGERA